MDMETLMAEHKQDSKDQSKMQMEETNKTNDVTMTLINKKKM